MSKRITFKFVSEMAERFGYHVEQWGGSKQPFEIYSNRHMPGVTTSGTLAEVWGELFWDLVRRGIYTSKGKKTRFYDENRLDKETPHAPN